MRLEVTLMQFGGLFYMSWGWQEWVVALLVAICVVRISYTVRVFFNRAKKNDNPCASCASGCELKNQLDRKKLKCNESKLPSKKNCCK